MDIAKLEELFAEELSVEHGGQTYAFRAPSLSDAAAICSRFGNAVEAEVKASGDRGTVSRAPYLKALAEAVELTLVVEDGGILPEGIGARMVLATGGELSPLGAVAAGLCGLPKMDGAAAVPDDLPT